jgi:hypothetical protein
LSGRLLDRPDAVGVDRRREFGHEVDSVAANGLKAGEGEGDHLPAGTQIDDPVLAGAVARGRARPFDQGIAARFDDHSGQNAAGRILDDAGDDTLCQDHLRDRCERCERGQRDKGGPVTSHLASSVSEQ